MVDRYHVSIARELLAFALTAVVLLFVWGSADKHRRAKELQDRSVEFAPNRRSYFAWPILVVYAFYAAVNQFTHIHRNPLKMIVATLIGILAVQIAFSFPATVIASNYGLQQVLWLRKSKQIRWVDIVEINTGEKCRIVAITGSDGTKIIHNRLLPDRPRLLNELKRHCGDELPSDFPREPDRIIGNSPTGREDPGNLPKSNLCGTGLRARGSSGE
jgi:hypothetical protein